MGKKEIKFINKKEINMKSGYKGIYVNCLDDGTVNSVQVIDSGNGNIPLSKQDYIDRNVKPAIKELPTKEKFFSKS